MNYLQLNSSKYILQTVAKYDGQYSWYNIVKWVDQFADSEKFPTSYEVLKSLSEDGYLRKVETEDNMGRYFITEKGRRELEVTESND